MIPASGTQSAFNPTILGSIFLNSSGFNNSNPNKPFFSPFSFKPSNRLASREFIATTNLPQTSYLILCSLENETNSFLPSTQFLAFKEPFL